MTRAFSLLVSLTLLALPARAQAPASANLWRVATSSLARPPALEIGATASFWNPAALSDSRLATGAQVVRTSNILGLSAVVAAASLRAGEAAHVGLVLARIDVNDLVRTTTSPNSEMGSIPVYEQMAGVLLGLKTATLQVSGLLRLHDARFDVIREGGVTIDAGFRFTPVPRLRVAAATYLFPIDFSPQETTDYFGGIEYLVAPSIKLAGTNAQIGARYGVVFRTSGDLEHAFGVGMMLDGHVRLDASLTGESAFGQRSWRPSLGISLRVGRYVLVVSRSSGLNDVGATYRVGLDIDVLR